MATHDSAGALRPGFFVYAWLVRGRKLHRIGRFDYFPGVPFFPIVFSCMVFTCKETIMRARKLRTAAKRRRKAFNHPTPKMLKRAGQLDRKRRKDRKKPR
jgi:hypothetical protein